MKIAIDARPLVKQKTGIGNYVHNLILRLSELDTENEYYLFSNEEFEHEVLKKPNWHKEISKDRIGALWLAFKVPFLLKEKKIDIFWGTQHMVPLIKFKNIKYVVTMHDLALYHFPHVATAYINIVNRIFIPRSLKLSDKIIAVSESTQNDIIKLFNTNKDKVVVIGEGGNSSYKPYNREESKSVMKEKYNVAAPYILYVGTIEPRKNLETLIKAFYSFSKDFDNYKLVIAGKKGWKYEGVFKLINELKMEDKVIFPGYIEDEYMLQLYNACDLFVYPSLYEGFGLPVLEAMQCGINVITTNVSSLPEVLPDKEALISPDNHLELAIKINDFVSKGIFFNEKNIELSKRYSWEKATEETLILLRHL